MPSRRSLLRSSGLALAAGVGLAGCLGDSDAGGGRRTSPSGAPPTDTPTPSSPAATPTPSRKITRDGSTATSGMGDERTVAGLPVVVSNPTARTSVIHLTTPDSMDVTRAPDGRLVLVDVRVGSDSPATPPAGSPAPGAFVLRAGDRAFEGTVSLADVGISLHERTTKYDPGYGTSRGWVAFSVPARFEATSPRIELGDAAWRLPERVADDLSKPLPEWELLSATLPGELAAGEPFEVSLEVRNTGDVAGRFRGVLNTAGIGPAYAPHPFVLDVAPGETGAWIYRDSAPDSARNVGFHLRTPVEDRDVQVSVTETAPTATPADG